MHRFPQLYDVCSTKMITDQQMVEPQGAAMSFRRDLGEILLQEWGSILQIISTFSFTHSSDHISWRWEASGNFTVKSLYNFLNSRGVPVQHPLLWWRLPVPPN